MSTQENENKIENENKNLNENKIEKENENKNGNRTEKVENSGKDGQGAAGAVSAASLRDWITEGHKNQIRDLPKGSSAVLIPILIRDGAYHVLYEVRAAKLHTQPGEICFPGGRIEPGELPLDAAVREATEELLIQKSQIEIVGELEKTVGPGVIPFYSYVGILNGYEGTWSADEVERVFTIPLEWILEHDPEIYKITLERHFPDDFPHEYVPGGPDYHWRNQYHTVPFYPDAVHREGDEPMLWGMTARVTYALAGLLRAGRVKL